MAIQQELRRLMAESKFDPNHPDNSRLYALLAEEEKLGRSIDAASSATAAISEHKGAPSDEDVAVADQQQLQLFRLEPDGCALISDEDFYSGTQFCRPFLWNFITDFNATDLRLKVLELRNQQVPEFKSMRMVPMYANDIDPDIIRVTSLIRIHVLALSVVAFNVYIY